MKTRWIRIGSVAAALAGAAWAQTTELVSRTDGSGNEASTDCSISADGRFVAFASDATNLVSGDTNGSADIFVYDASTGAIERASVATGGAQANGLCEVPSISSDGRFVAFSSIASNLVAGDLGGFYDVFVRDRLNGTTEMVSVSTGGAQGSGDSHSPAISADGRYVAFWSFAPNLVAGDSNGTYDIFLRDRQLGTTERVSVATVGVQGNGMSLYPSISSDGRYVVFVSDATNLVAGDTNGVRDVFVRDRQLGTTVRASVGFGGVNSDGMSLSPVGISSNGRYVCFDSFASNLVAGGTGNIRHVFVRDMLAGTTEVASVGPGSAQGNDDSLSSAITPDGRFVVFASFATNLIIGDTNGVADTFVRDRQNGTTARISIATSGAQGDLGVGLLPTISSDGSRVAFYSYATNMVPNDGNGTTDVFLRDLSASRTALVSHGARSGNAGSEAPVVSADGSLVAFRSDASDLVDGDVNGASDVFVRDESSGTIELISVAMNGGDANGSSYVPAMTPDGRFVAFASNATNLVPGDTNSTYDVFLRDRQLGTTERISVATNGTQGNSTSGYFPDTCNPSCPPSSLGISITPDGRFVAFGSLAFNLDPRGGQQCQAYVRDRQAGTTELVSLSSTGAYGLGFNQLPSITPDGRYVVFTSDAPNLVPGDTNGVDDIFLRDRQSGTTVRVNLASGGSQANDASFLPVISANGRFVAFISLATNLVVGDTNGVSDVFVRDLQAGTTELVSVSSAGLLGNGASIYWPSISEDGRFVVFSSDASNLVSGDTNGQRDVFLRDRLLKTTTLISVSTTGAQGNGTSGTLGTDLAIDASLSPDGRYIAFASLASNFDSIDGNGAADVFLRDRGAASAFAPFCFGDGTGAACPCANSGAPGHGCENSSTTGGAHLGASGAASLAADSVVLTSSGEKPTATSVLLSGTTIVNSLHYGDGLRCVGGTLKRLYTHNAVGGVVTFPQGADLHVSAQSAASGDVILLGSSRIYQVYYRDPSATFCPTPAGSTFNISNAIAIAWGT